MRVATTRYYVSVQVDGDCELLECWPDEAGADLRPVDRGLGEWAPGQRGSREDYDYDAELGRHNALLAQDRWTLGRRDEHSPLALYTFVDLTEQEAADVEPGRRDPAAEVAAGIAQVRPIVAAIAEQTRAFFDERLPESLADRIDQRRDRLRAHQSVLTNLSWPDAWKYPDPVVEAADNGPGGVSSFSQRSAGRTGAGSSEDAFAATDDDLELGRPSRLADASFADLLRTMRVWADAVERHPLAYRSLGEDWISDLLAATLNAALPGAHREVYSRGGKADIFVRGSTLASGAAPAVVFICESKFWDGKEKAVQALDQLFGYVEAKDTAAVLLFFVRLANPAKARAEALLVLAARDECGGEVDSDVKGWPTLRFKRDGRTLRVCVAFVDLPDLADSGEGEDTAKP